MKIKEEDSQHLVITSTLGERLLGVFVAVAGISFLVSFLAVLFIFTARPTGFFKEYLFIGVPFIVVNLIVIYIGVRRLMGKRIVLEKSTNSVILKAPSLLLVRQKRIIPFAEVNSVAITYKSIHSGGQYGGYNRAGWQVSLNTGGQMVKIDHTTDRENMLYLADKISKLMGKEVVDNSERPG